MRTRPIIGALALLLTAGGAPAALATGVTFVEAIRDGLRLGDAIAVTVSPDGAHVYAAAPASNSLVSFARDGGTGRLVRIDQEIDGVDGRLTVVGKGPNLTLPSLPLAEEDLVSQLVGGGGVCFETLLQAVRNDGKVVEGVID